MGIENKGLITVVIPVYNVEKYLDRCLESIVNQTYKKLEIILVDDGSPDKCPQLCDEWAERDSRIKVIHKNNEGLGMARNTGIDNATGEYITFFDSDDYIDLNTVECCYRKAVEYEADVVSFGYKRVDGNGKVLEEKKPNPLQYVYKDDEIKKKFIPELLAPDYNTGRSSKLTLSACMAMFSLEIINSRKWRFVSERDIISEDVYSLLDLYHYVHCVVVVSESFYSYFVNTSSLTKTFRQDRYKEIVRFYKASLQLCEIHNDIEEVKHKLSHIYAAYTVADIKQIVGSDLKLDRKRNLLEEVYLDDTFMKVMSELKNDKLNTKSRMILIKLFAKKQFFLATILIYIKTMLK